MQNRSSVGILALRRRADPPRQVGPEITGIEIVSHPEFIEKLWAYPSSAVAVPHLFQKRSAWRSGR